jgi:beta-galactosidase
MASPEYNDAHWRKLNVPHDWAIEGDFYAGNPSGASGGALPGGIGWYRKNVKIEKCNNVKIFLEFDGVYMNSTVYVNGHEVGFRPYGYSSFEYDITPYVHEGENVVAVRVDNSDQPNSRWYSGCGIYRHVWLTKTNPIHIKHWGVYIHDGKVEVDFVNPTNQRVKVVNELLDATGKPVPLSFRASTPMSSRPKRRDLSTTLEMTGLSRDLSTPVEMTGLSRDLSTTLEMTMPSRALSTLKKWSCESPYIYKVRTQLIAGGKVVDEVETTTGFRDFRFDAKTGFWLNGKNFKINGVCEHHDFGCLGAALSEDALHRKLVKLRAMGVNAIRCSHNPPAPELLNMCDTMGLIVMDESFDMWRRKKTQNDYARFFDEWHERDLTDLVLRDRNHPSVLMWSIGNEVLEQWSSADADTLTLEQANLILNAGHDASTLAKDGELSVQSLLTQHLAEIVKRYDTTRPITAGCNEPSPNNHLFKSGTIDIIGFNYHHENVKDVPRNFPGKPFIFSESVSALQSRGYYMMPSDSIYKAPKQWWLPYTDPSFMCSAYDNMHASWSSTHEETWDVVKHNAFVAGQFIWTGFDYIGEPTPYGFPARSSYFGLIDLAGFPKDSYYMYQSEWTDKPMLHLFPHWNWLPGQEIDLWAYYNQADEAELFINGKSQGIRKKSRNASSRPSTPMSSRATSRDLSTSVEMTEGEALMTGVEDGALTTEVGGGGRMTEAPGEDGAPMSSRAQSRDLSTEYHVAWRVRFEPGEIKVVTRKSGKEVCTQTIRTAGAPDHIRLSVDYKGKDLTFITAEVVDKDGNLCPWADNQIHFKGNVVATDNGCQTSMERFTAPTRRAFHGKCLVIVRGSGTLAAQSIDLGQASLNF